MRLLRRDLRGFSLHKPTFVTDDDGDGVNVYGVACATFYGHKQPFSERQNPQAYGMTLAYASVVYTESTADFQPLDRMFDGTTWFEIKVVQRWASHLRLMVEEVQA